MGNLPIVFTDAYGTHLEVDRPGGAPARGGDVLLRTTGSGHFVLAADVDLIAAISEAAGKPAPIILERPELAGTHSQFAGTFGGTLKVGPAEGGLMVAGDTRLPLGLARPLAAHIVARAEAMERAGPDPADVEALADVIRETSTSMHSGDIARAILRAGYRPPERKGGGA